MELRVVSAKVIIHSNDKMQFSLCCYDKMLVNVAAYVITG